MEECGAKCKIGQISEIKQKVKQNICEQTKGQVKYSQ